MYACSNTQERTCCSQNTRTLQRKKKPIDIRNITLLYTKNMLNINVLSYFLKKIYFIACIALELSLPALISKIFSIKSIKFCNYLQNPKFSADRYTFEKLLLVFLKRCQLMPAVFRGLLTEEGDSGFRDGSLTTSFSLSFPPPFLVRVNVFLLTRVFSER